VTVHVGEGGQLVECREQWIAGEQPTVAQHLGRFDGRQVGRRLEVVKGAELCRELADGAAALIELHRGPGTAQGDARAALEHQPVGAHLAPVGDHLGIADLGGEQWPQ
jgi:hypothetical protein